MVGRTKSWTLYHWSKDGRRMDWQSFSKGEEQALGDGYEEYDADGLLLKKSETFSSGKTLVFEYSYIKQK